MGNVCVTVDVQKAPRVTQAMRGDATTTCVSSVKTSSTPLTTTPTTRGKASLRASTPSVCLQEVKHFRAFAVKRTIYELKDVIFDANIVLNTLSCLQSCVLKQPPASSSQAEFLKFYFYLFKQPAVISSSFLATPLSKTVY